MPDDNHESTVHEKKETSPDRIPLESNVIKVAGVGMVSLSSLPALGSAKKPSSAEVIGWTSHPRTDEVTSGSSSTYDTKASRPHPNTARIPPPSRVAHPSRRIWRRTTDR